MNLAYIQQRLKVASPSVGVGDLISNGELGELLAALEIGAARWIAVPGEWKPFPPTVAMVVNDWMEAAVQKLAPQKESKP